MKSDYENALLWNAIGRDDRLMEILLEKATELEQKEIYYRFKSMNDNQPRMDLQKFCSDLTEREKEGLERIKQLEKNDNESYQKRLKEILSIFTRKRMEVMNG